MCWNLSHTTGVAEEEGEGEEEEEEVDATTLMTIDDLNSTAMAAFEEAGGGWFVQKINALFIEHKVGAVC